MGRTHRDAESADFRVLQQDCINPAATASDKVTFGAGTRDLTMLLRQHVTVLKPLAAVAGAMESRLLCVRTGVDTAFFLDSGIFLSKQEHKNRTYTL